MVVHVRVDAGIKEGIEIQLNEWERYDKWAEKADNAIAPKHGRTTERWEMDIVRANIYAALAAAAAPRIEISFS